MTIDMDNTLDCNYVFRSFFQICKSDLQEISATEGSQVPCSSEAIRRVNSIAGSAGAGSLQHRHISPFPAFLPKAL